MNSYFGARFGLKYNIVESTRRVSPRPQKPKKISLPALLPQSTQVIPLKTQPDDKRMFGFIAFIV